MRHKILLSLLAAIALSRAGTALAQKPDYPLYACSIERQPPFTQDELDKMAVWFDCINTSVTADQSAYLKKRNPGMLLLGSVNSSYSTGPTEYRYIESEWREAISMYRAADLASDLDAAATGVTLRPISDKPIVLKASTEEGDVSAAENATQQYVTWIRIDDEFMRINAWEPETRQITVKRGLSGTTPAPHKAGSPVLAPVYIGVLGHTWSGYYPGGYQKFLRYALRTDSEAAYAYKGNMVAEQVERNGLDGVWLDIISPDFFNQCNMQGEQVIPWNFSKGIPFTRNDYGLNQQRKAQFIRRYVERKLGRKVTLTANNFSNKYFPEEGNGQQYLLPIPEKPDPVDGLILEGFGGEYLHKNFRTGSRMMNEIRIVMDMEARKLRGFCTYDNNLSRRDTTPEETKAKEQYETYAYAGYLMGVEPAGTVLFGIAAYRRPGTGSPKPYLWLHPQYFYRIGKPLETVPYQEFERYRLPGHITYCREFENAFVFINVSPDETDVVDLKETSKIGRALYNPENRETVSKIELGPHTGVIVKKAEK